MKESEPEIVDIVDEQDNVLFQTTKKEAHDKGLLHRTAICEVIDSSGRWTLIQQNAHKQDPGVYLSPIGGHVTAGETAEEALRREMEEEGGLTGNVQLKYVGKVIHNREVPHLGTKENHFFILYEAFADDDLILNEESHAQRRFTPDELKEALQTRPEQFGEPFKYLLKNFYPEILG